MYSTVRTAVLEGISAIPVQVEVDISTGMPVFDMVGNLTSEVREAKERVKTALHSVGIVLPAKRITVNLSPANIKKTGTGFDLPIAVAVLTAMGVIDADSIKGCTLAGELNLAVFCRLYLMSTTKALESLLFQSRMKMKADSSAVQKYLG